MRIAMMPLGGAGAAKAIASAVVRMVGSLMNPGDAR
jgi:hypothetical protein